MGKIIIALLLVVSLSGCVTEHTTRAKIVKIPIIICPVPEHTEIPVLAIEALTEEDKGDWEKIAKSYAVTIIRLQAYSKDLREQIEVYRSGNGEVTE